MNDEQSYTMQAGEVAALLRVNRMTVHNLTEAGQLSFVWKAHGRRQWKYFNRTEIESYAATLGIKPV